MRGGLISGAGVALAAVLMLTVNLLVGTLAPGARVDLTAQGLYTLSDGTRRILADLPEPVTLDFYYSARALRELPQVRTYAERVEALLREYARRSGGRVTLRVIDPEPFSPAEDAAVQAGVRAIPAGPGGEAAYFGIAARNATDREAVLAFLSPATEDTLEYDVTRLVYSLTRDGQPTIALVSSLPLNGSMVPISQQRTPPWVIVEQMRAQFGVRVLGAQFDAIPPETDVLMVAHPRGLDDKALYRIDQFVLRGGRALVFVDPYVDVEAPPRDPMMPTMTMPKEPSDLGGLLEAWGVGWDASRIVVDPGAARQVNFGGGAAQDYPAWLALEGDNFNRQDVVTARLSRLYPATAGALLQTGRAGVEITPLVWAGDSAGTVDRALVNPPPDLRRMASERTAAPRAVLAARVRGSIASAFAQGPPDGMQGQGGGADGAHLAASRAPANLIVVADADLLYDRFWAQVQDAFGEMAVMPFADNGSFVINALDNLSGSDALIAVRSVASYARPFTVVEKLERAAQERLQQRAAELEQALTETDRRIAELQSARGDGAGPLLTPEQQAEVERFRDERARIGQELRVVQRDLRRDIEGLEARLKFVNIGAVPLLVALVALVVLAWPARRRRRAA